MADKSVKELINTLEYLPSVTDVAEVTKFFKDRLTLKVINMFTYDGFPEDLNLFAYKQQILEGAVGIYKHNKYGMVNATISLYGTGPYTEWGVKPKFNPTNTLATGDYTIGDTAEVIYADSKHVGLMPLIDKYARLLADSMCTLDKTLHIMREPNLFNTVDDKSARSLKAALTANELGQTEIVLGKDIMNEISTIEQSSYAIGTNYLTEQVMTYNSILNMFLREIGVPSVDEKKERLSDEEVDQSNMMLETYINDSLRTQQECWDIVNNMFGYNVTIKLSPEWDELINGKKEDTIDEESDDIELTEEPADESSEEANGDTGTADAEKAETGDSKESEQADESGQVVDDITEAVEDIIEAIEDAVEPDKEDKDGED